MDLAREVGVEASRSQRVEFLGQSTFIVERWDRADGMRLHAEDMNQALGRPLTDKYSVTAPQVAKVLAEHRMTRRFVRQLAFNAAFGNADAHAKNYSVLLAGRQVVLAPLYDAVPVYFWPGYDTRYAMAIGKARHPAELTEKNWRAFADEAELDPDLVCEEAFGVIRAVADRYEDRFASAGVDPTRMRMIARHARLLRRALPNR